MTKPQSVGRLIVSGIGAVLIMHLLGFLLSRGDLLARQLDFDLGLHFTMATIAIQLTAVVAWVYLPLALFLLHRKTLWGAEGFARAAAIGFVLPTLSWCVVAPVTRMLIPSLIGPSILTGVSIGLITWFILSARRTNVPDVTDQSQAPHSGML